MSVTPYHHGTQSSELIPMQREPTKLEIFLQELQMTQQAITETGAETLEAAREKAKADAALQETLTKLTVDGLASGQLTVEEGERFVDASQQLMESLNPPSKPSEEIFETTTTIEIVELNDDTPITSVKVLPFVEDLD